MKKNSEKYLFGFISHDSNVKDIVHIVEPYMIIEAEDDVQAMVNYCTIHDIASHNTAELIAKKSIEKWDGKLPETYAGENILGLCKLK